MASLRSKAPRRPWAKRPSRWWLRWWLGSLVVLFACSSGDANQPVEERLERYMTERRELRPEQWLELAAAAEKGQDWEYAAYSLDRAKLGHPELAQDLEWIQRRVRAAEFLDDSETAAGLRSRWLELEPENFLLAVDQADDWQRMGRGAEARRLLEGFRQHREHRPAALQALAVLLERDEAFLEAAQVLEELASESEPERAQILFQEASRLRETGGDLGGALESLEQSLAGVDLEEEERRTLERLKAFEEGEPQSVADAVALMRMHPDPDYRFRGAIYLSRGPFPDQLRVFASVLGDPDTRVVRVAIRELSLRGDDAWAPEVGALLAHADPQVQLAAVQALERIGTFDQLPSLVDLLLPEDRSLFRATRKTLEAISGHRIGAELDPKLPRRQEIAAEWRKWLAEGPKPAEPLENQKEISDPEQAQEALLESWKQKADGSSSESSEEKQE